MAITYIFGPRRSGKSIVGRGLVHDLCDRHELSVLHHEGITLDRLIKDQDKFRHVIVCWQQGPPLGFPTADAVIKISLPKGRLE